MSELKLPRLLQAAKEFNIGPSTLVEFLVGKGFSRDALTVTSKLTEDMYRALQLGFQGDKVAKGKADMIEIPKSVQAERRKRDEEEISFRKERDHVKQVFKEEPKQEPAVVTAIQEPVMVSIPEPVKDVLPQPTVVSQQEPPAQPEPTAQKQTPASLPEVDIQQSTYTAVSIAEPVTPIAEPAITQQPIASTVSGPEILRIEAPELEGPKIIDKIDLSAIDSSTKPRRDFRKPSTADEQLPKQEVVKEEAPVTPEVVPEATLPLEEEVFRPTFEADEAFV